MLPSEIIPERFISICLSGSMYLYCVYPAMSKSLEQMANCLKRAEASAILIVLWLLSVMSMLILLLFLSIAQHESGTRKTISWSLTSYNKNCIQQIKFYFRPETLSRFHANQYFLLLLNVECLVEKQQIPILSRSLFRALFISNLDRKSAWCTLYWEQMFKRHRIENGLLKRK
jgi:hypothetical protein